MNYLSDLLSLYHPEKVLPMQRTQNALLAHPKVGQLAMTLAVEQDVIQFEVAVDHAVRVEELQRQRHLGRVEPASQFPLRNRDSTADHASPAAPLAGILILC